MLVTWDGADTATDGGGTETQRGGRQRKRYVQDVPPGKMPVMGSVFTSVWHMDIRVSGACVCVCVFLKP